MINGLEFFLASKWLAGNLPGARIDKGVVRTPEGLFGIEFYSRKLGGKRVLVLGKGILGFLPPGGSLPGETWKFGRQFLSGLAVSSAGQVGFDRVFRIDFSDGAALVAEIFDGNFILIGGSQGKIVFAREQREWKGRKIAVGQGYVPPAGPEKLPLEIRESDLVSEPGNPVGRVLAVSLGFGPEVSQAILDEAGVGPEPVSPEGRKRIIEAIRRLFSEEAPREPVVSLEDLISGKASGKSERVKKIERLGKSISILEGEEAALKAAGELILGNLQEVDEAISAARRGGRPGIVREVRRKEGRILVELPAKP